ncbi:alpha/beta fold hydrolase [Flammeovirga pectinis]|uniref:Alpha/beta fold hydrolase n=1 Tax=Flammeovirga pectinis TaxID=2494373 RepID=A0A3Q9FMF0_9BACT|nr:alpha/beta fold hydrolase [Flammeovirga pectinis]AZQ61037.1 alpha/beta fold hydrolase [Flammeovirga pectinis]
MTKKLFIVTLFFLLSISSHSQNLVGPWSGTLTVQTGKIDIIFHITHNGQIFQGKMDVPAQHLKSIPIHEVKYQEPFITIDLPNLGIKYTGHVLDDEHIEGKFEQGGFSFPMTLFKDLEIETPLKKPQEPLPPYPYVSKEVKFKNEKANILLAGTFTRPTDVKKYPTVILISGSGPQDRNQEILGHKSFLLLADELTKKGIAVLRFDDRGTGESSGNFKAASTLDFSTDVEAAYQYLLSRKDVDPTKIGLLGHSEGGTIAGIVASKNKNIDFIVLMASPGLRGKELMLHQKALIEKKGGIHDHAIAKNQKIFSGAYSIVINNEQPLFDKLADYFQHQFDHQLNDQQINNLARTFSSNWMKEFIKLDPATYFSTVTCPVLALNGTKDVQVITKENLDAINNALKKAGNTDIDIEEIKGVNHLFQECDTGLPNEYGEIEQTLSPVLLEKVTTWVTIKTK